MNLIPSFLRRKSKPPTASTATLANSGWLYDWGAGYGIQTFGHPVSEHSSMAVAAVYRCVTLISGVVASLDLNVYTNSEKDGQTRVVNRLTPLFQINPFPGRQMTSFVWKELIATNLLLHGNHYSVIRYDQAGRVVGLEYAPPQIVKVGQINFRNAYVVNWPNGRERESVDQEDMIHIPGPGFDGILGMSRIHQNAKNTVAMAKSLEEVMGRAFDNAVSPSIIVKLPQGMDPDAVKNLKARITQEYAGRTNTGKPMFVDAGTEVDAMQINLVDLAAIEAMQASTKMICQFFGVPPELLGESGVSTWGSGISQLILGFLKFSLNSDLERIEAELSAKLAGPGQYILFDRDQLLAMDAESAAKVASQEIACGLSTINEARIRKHRPIVEGGDTPLINSTNISLDRAINPPAPPTQQGKAPPEPTKGEPPL